MLQLNEKKFCDFCLNWLDQNDLPHAPINNVSWEKGIVDRGEYLMFQYVDPGSKSSKSIVIPKTRRAEKLFQSEPKCIHFQWSSFYKEIDNV